MTIRDYIKIQLLPPMKRYPTKVQDTLLEIITSRLEELYELTVRFPEILSPNQSRLDILNAIITQFNFKIRDEADIKEQIAIIDGILELYRKRGSIETIENVWKYYGGDLPHELQVNIPSYDLFRYSISRFSGTSVFPDGEHNRSGSFEIILHNSNYPIDRLKEFLLEELVAAGNRIYFTNSVYSLLVGEDAAYKYDVIRDTVEAIELTTSCTQLFLNAYFFKYSYDREGNLLDNEYTGYFILGCTKLDSEIIGGNYEY